MGAHSLIGPSSAKRTLTCPGWVALAKTLPDGLLGRSSVYAAEGTLAHRLAEEVLKGTRDLSSIEGRTFDVEGHEFTPDDDFVEHVSAYVDYVRGLEALGYDVRLETRVSVEFLWSDTSFFGEDLPFGTADCIALSPDGTRLVVADLKFGRGVTVSAGDNPQLRTYALGALGALTPQEAERVEVVETVIVQPRVDHDDGTIRNEILSYPYLLDWGRNVLKPALELAFKPGAPRSVSDECRFCPALAVCPDKRQTVQDAARHVFAASADPTDAWGVPPPDLPSLDPAALADLLSRCDDLEVWARQVRDFCHRLLESGGDLPGFKLVDKRAVRRWADDHAAADALTDAGLDRDAVYERKPLSPAKVEALAKSIRKQDPDPAAAVLDALPGLVVQQSSGTSVARADDKRPAVRPKPTAREAFSEPAET